MKSNRLRSGFITVLSALLCVVIGLAIGFLLLMLLGWSRLKNGGGPFTFGDVVSTAYNSGFKRVLMGGWYNVGRVPRGPRKELAQAAPLIEAFLK